MKSKFIFFIIIIIISGCDMRSKQEKKIRLMYQFHNEYDKVQEEKPANDLLSQYISGDEASSTELAILENNADKLRTVLQNNSIINLNKKNKKGYRLLEICYYLELWKCFEVLLENGANFRFILRDDKIELAKGLIVKKKERLFKELVKRGYEVKGKKLLFNAIDASSSNHFLMYLVNSGVDIEEKNEEQITPLHYAIHYRKNYMAITLIELGADVFFKSKTNYNLLHTLLIKNDRWDNSPGYNELAKILIFKGVDFNELNDDKTNAFLMAVWRGHTEIVEVMLECGADITIKDGKDMYAVTGANKAGYNPGGPAPKNAERVRTEMIDLIFEYYPSEIRNQLNH